MTSTPGILKISGTDREYPENAIVSTRSGGVITEKELIDELEPVRVVFVGEQHRDPAHHKIQLTILKSLYEKNLDLVVGMEMFDHTYQPVLDRWSAGDLSEKEFLRQTHWYANWKFPYRLYRDILEFIRENHIKLIGLNVPFHLPAKIAVGGIASLRPDEINSLPGKIDTSQADHRAYVKEIFSRHRIPGRDDFEYFYEAQCVWEDAMAQSIAENVTDNNKVVALLGNGHIFRHFGVPDRVHARIDVPFRTIYPAPVGTSLTMDAGDFLWVTPLHHPSGMKRKRFH